MAITVGYKTNYIPMMLCSISIFKGTLVHTLNHPKHKETASQNSIKPGLPLPCARSGCRHRTTCRPCNKWVSLRNILPTPLGLWSYLTCATNVGKFSGMIHWLTIFIIIPATPSNPTHSLRLTPTLVVNVSHHFSYAISWVHSPLTNPNQSWSICEIPRFLLMKNPKKVAGQNTFFFMAKFPHVWSGESKSWSFDATNSPFLKCRYMVFSQWKSQTMLVITSYGFTMDLTVKWWSPFHCQVTKVFRGPAASRNFSTGAGLESISSLGNLDQKSRCLRQNLASGND